MADDIVSVEAAQIQPVPRTVAGASSDFLSGLVSINDTMIALIDLPDLLSMSVGEGADLSGGDSNIATPAEAN